MKVKCCQLKSACKSSGFKKFSYFLTGGFLGSSVSSSEQSTSASSQDSCHTWNFDDDELTNMWNNLHGYDGMHYAIRVILDYDDEGHCYTGEFRGHLEEWVANNTIFPAEHGVNCGSQCMKCYKMACSKCKGNELWKDDLDEWVFFCDKCYKEEKTE